MNDAVERIANSWEYILPEIVLVATACVHFLAGPFLISERGEAPSGLRHRWGGLALVGLLTAGGFWLNSRPTTEIAPLGPFRLDELAWFVRGLSLAAGVLLLLTAWNRVEDATAAEHHACLLLITAGVSLVGAANDLVTIFLALELVSIPTYVLLYLGRRGAAAQEAVIKYFLLSIFSSAILLFGFAYLYGVTGTTNLTAVYSALAAGGGSAMPAVLLISAAAAIAGLGFRITAVPFHFYAPDVFQGTSTGGAAMLSFVPKIAGFVALVRVLAIPVAAPAAWSLVESVEPILWGLAVLSMCVGNVLAFLQTDVRRMMAYSSIAHAGYMLVGLAVLPHDGQVAGVPALLFYLVAYGAMTVGVFAILAAVRTGDAADRAETVDDLSGLGQAHPIAAILLAIFLFSLTGLPPTAGFLGKLNLFLAAWSAGTSSTRSLALVMAVNAAISAWYYLRLIGAMYLQPARTAARPLESPAFVGGALCAAATIGLFIAPDWLWQTVARIGG